MNTRDVNKNRIAKHGLEFTAAQHERTRRTFRDLMEKIELEIDSNDGIYPYNNGVLNALELLRRLTLSPAYLQKKSEKVRRLRAEVNAWILQINTTIKSDLPSIRAEVNRREKIVRRALDASRQALCETELKMQRARRELDEEQRKTKLLEEENRILIEQLSGLKIVRIHPKR